MRAKMFAMSRTLLKSYLLSTEVLEKALLKIRRLCSVMSGRLFDCFGPPNFNLREGSAQFAHSRALRGSATSCQASRKLASCDRSWTKSRVAECFLKCFDTRRKIASNRDLTQNIRNEICIMGDMTTNGMHGVHGIQYIYIYICVY